jgi:transcriptional antiterminator RfaH
MDGGVPSAVAFPSQGQRWFAVLTKPYQEDTADLQLRRQEFGVYLPKIKIGRRVGSHGWREVIEPLFPRYLFARFDPTLKSAAPIRSTRGVCGLVHFGRSDPAVVPDPVIEALRARENSSGLHVDRSARLAKGDKVELLQGPFRGMLASFEEPDGNQRVVLMFTAIGLNRLTVARAWISRVTA